MGFFSRLWRIIRGKANDTVEAVEDANFETVVKQNIRDLETELDRLIKASAEAMSNYNQLEAEYQRAVDGSEDWKTKAKKALAAGNEDLAKKALAKKSEFDSQVASLQTSVENARNVKEKLKKQVDIYKQKIDEGRRNASTLIARKNAAAAQKKVAKVLAGVKGDNNAFASLKRFEEKVAKDEASARAFEELGTATSEQSELDKEFAALDVSSTDDELEALKAEMMAEKSGSTKRL